jgi:isopropylmalate/homocitrate/citramalate synthase
MNENKAGKSSYPWKTENWFVSPWNYTEEVTKDYHPPKKVKIHDVTLRDGEQQAGIVFTKDDKIRIAEKLAEVGVHRIEAGMPLMSTNDMAAIKEITKRNLPSEIFCFSRCITSDVSLARDCGVDGVIMEIPGSQQFVEQAYRWPMQKAIDLSIEATSFAKEQGLYTVFFTVDATRSDIDWLLDLLDKVATEGHMDAITLVDTQGVLSPAAATYFARRVKERISKPLEIHFHNDFGLGVANTLNAVMAGAEVIHSTVNGIGDRCGNTPMAETAMALLTMFAIDVGLDFAKMNELSKLVEELSGVPIPANKPVVGDDIYTIEAGMVSMFYDNVYEKNLTTVFPVNPDFTGHHGPKIGMSKKSGVTNIRIWAQNLNLEISDSESEEIVQIVKRRSHDLKRPLSEDEFREIVENFQAEK